MPEYTKPFTHQVLADGTIPEAASVTRRHLQDLQGLFADTKAEAALIPENPLVYEVFEASGNPEVAGQLRYSTTVMRPGKVGNEYFMTKGHYHAQGDRGELYYGLRGEGYLLLQTPEGEIDAQRMTPGSASYVPPFWGHRTINTGPDPFIFLAVYPADAGYDYKTIADEGFAVIIVERNGAPDIIPNPRYHGS
jgi:glucose-6-phosphate isomerase